jgi:hypothetical protein
MPSKINAEWHQAHKMPKNPTPAERLEWHVAHAKACACRPMPASMLAALKSAAKKSNDRRARGSTSRR